MTTRKQNIGIVLCLVSLIFLNTVAGQSDFEKRLENEMRDYLKFNTALSDDEIEKLIALQPPKQPLSCPSAPDFKSALVYALKDYYRHPSKSKFTRDEVKDMIVFYLSQDLSTADCFSSGDYSGKSISSILIKTSSCEDMCELIRDYYYQMCDLRYELCTREGHPSGICDKLKEICYEVAELEYELCMMDCGAVTTTTTTPVTTTTSTTVPITTTIPVTTTTVPVNCSVDIKFDKKEYCSGDSLNVTLEFRYNGALTDPSKFQVMLYSPYHPNGYNVTSYFSKISTGIYKLFGTVGIPGTRRWVVEATINGCDAKKEDRFEVIDCATTTTTIPTTTTTIPGTTTTTILTTTTTSTTTSTTTTSTTTTMVPSTTTTTVPGTTTTTLPSTTTTTPDTTTTTIILKYSFSNFVCSSIENGYTCSLDYENNVGERIIVLFLFKDNETGKIVSAPASFASEGTGTAASMLYCNSVNPGDYKVSWRAHLESDSKLKNPIAWSKSTEIKTIKCPTES